MSSNAPKHMPPPVAVSAIAGVVVPPRTKDAERLPDIRMANPYQGMVGADFIVTPNNKEHR